MLSECEFLYCFGSIMIIFIINTNLTILTYNYNNLELYIGSPKALLSIFLKKLILLWFMTLSYADSTTIQMTYENFDFAN